MLQLRRVRGNSWNGISIIRTIKYVRFNGSNEYNCDITKYFVSREQSLCLNMCLAGWNTSPEASKSLLFVHFQLSGSGFG
jgi:hypothetical protein